MFTIFKPNKSGLALKLKGLNDESGAVTVDWVVLSATLVVLGAIVIGIYKEAVFGVSSEIENAVVRSAGDLGQ